MRQSDPTKERSIADLARYYMALAPHWNRRRAVKVALLARKVGIE